MAAQAIIVSTKPLDLQEARVLKGIEEACLAVQIIHDEQLYKLRGFDSFTDYCNSGSLGIRRSRAYQLLAAASQLKALPAKAASLIANEGAARELDKIPVDEQAALLEELAVDGKPVKAKDIKEAVQAKEKKGTYNLTKAGDTRQNGRTAAKQKPTKAKAEKIVDKLGKPIRNENVALAFSQASRINGLIARTRALNKDITEITTLAIGTHIPKQNLCSDLHNVQIALRHGLPYRVCPKCKGEGKGCTGCRKAGWITKTMHNRLPGVGK